MSFSRVKVLVKMILKQLFDLKIPLSINSKSRYSIILFLMTKIHLYEEKDKNFVNDYIRVRLDSTSKKVKRCS